ncbi:MAG: HlyD family secretion protein [Afipia felis]|uniref:Inner membrane protein yibH n=2 Tax=Afipia felis TaxID=1035 RepID=A0A380W2S6_AFIFE|nr:HlyD family secretion protein [Afipia felis]EKS30325.1 efflux transporter, RND family, MFP subunit [Afipia felis ATCC 53690]MBN9604521.1 HlyD family secretion protein [Afipia felis]SUU75070.1 Inner membrane protein yibH [Afipia felis]SUU83136.1 Inner membrane protein yibH [Afipia felis]
MSERLPLLRLFVTLLTLAVAAVAGWYLWRTYEDSPWTRDARVRANVVQVTPDVSGVVIDVRIKDNQSVKVGDVLFVIDQARFQLAVSNAEAALAGAQSLRDQRLEEYARRQRLSSASISDEALAQAHSAALSAQAAYDQAQAALNVAKLNLARTQVRSSVNGHVTNLLLDKGDYATAGKAMVAVVDSDSYYVAGYFEETKLRSIHIGDNVSIRLLGYSSELRGHVESVARAITDRDNAPGSELIANVNPTFNWVRLAQRIPVRIAIDHVPDGVTLSAGMTATVVVTGPGDATPSSSKAP